MVRKIRVCFVANAESVTMRNIMEWFGERYETHLISRERHEVRNVTTHFPIQINRKIPKIIRRYPENFLFFLYFIFKFNKLKPDLMIGIYLFPYGSFCLFADKKTRIVICPWGSDITLLASKKRFHSWIARKIFERAFLVQVDSRMIYDKCLEIGCERSKLKLICIPGVDTERFRPTSRKIPYSIVSTRAFYHSYDIPTTIRAFAEVLKEMPNARLFLLGDANRGSADSERNLIVSESKKLGIYKKITWLGFQKPKNVRKYLAKSHVYVSSSITDSTSVSLLEAMSMGLPVVVSDIPANKEWVTSGYNGFIFDKGNSEHMARLIIRTLENEDRMKSFGERSRKIAVEKADSDINMKQFEREMFG
jgi:glycosyltransferase involved in cell wall biosynthesis